MVGYQPQQVKQSQFDKVILVMINLGASAVEKAPGIW